MSLRNDFFRVSKRRRCPICGKPDWCMIARDSADDPWGVICARVVSGVTWGEAGDLHVLTERPRRGRRRCMLARCKGSRG